MPSIIAGHQNAFNSIRDNKPLYGAKQFRNRCLVTARLMFCQVRGKSRVFDIKIERRAATRHPRDASTVNQIFSHSSTPRLGLLENCMIRPDSSFHRRPPQQTSGKIASLAPEQIPQSKRKSRDVLIAPGDFYRSYQLFNLQ